MIMASLFRQLTVSNCSRINWSRSLEKYFELSGGDSNNQKKLISFLKKIFQAKLTLSKNFVDRPVVCNSIHFSKRYQPHHQGHFFCCS